MNRTLLATLFMQFLFIPHPGRAQVSAEKAKSQSAREPETDAQS
jgi:hypothetical protein